MILKMKIPKYVNNVLEILRFAGFEAYPVGGCVRDACLGVRPNDWDVCTSALPEDVLSVFPRAHPTGIKHGTVTVVSEKNTVEVTTFRTEGEYSDHRHPDSVCFVRDVREDLARRDFTINAMALGADGKLIDPFGGENDLKNGIIRCVGDAERRFSEDLLRILRALRFSARFGFEIEGKTHAAMKKCAALTKALAAERVQTEIEKMLLTPKPEVLSEVLELGILDGYIPDIRCEKEKLKAISALPLRREPRWAAFCVIIGADADFLKALKLDTKTVTTVKNCVELMQGEAPQTRTDYKRILGRLGEEDARCYTAVYDAVNGKNTTKKLREVIASGECCTVRGLKISGRELGALGISGRAVGECLNMLLQRVMENDAYNRPDILMSLAGDWRANNGQL